MLFDQKSPCVRVCSGPGGVVCGKELIWYIKIFHCIQQAAAAHFDCPLSYQVRFHPRQGRPLEEAHTLLDVLLRLGAAPLAQDLGRRLLGDLGELLVHEDGDALLSVVRLDERVVADGLDAGVFAEGAGLITVKFNLEILQCDQGAMLPLVRGDHAVIPLPSKSRRAICRGSGRAP